MNIFALHRNPLIAAKMMCDKHVVKMILESAQILSSVKRFIDGTRHEFAKNKFIWKLDNSFEDETIYRAGWLKHPSTLWAMKSRKNYVWLWHHFKFLNDEFKRRFQKPDHKSFALLGEILKTPPKNLPIIRKNVLPTPAMPEECLIYKNNEINVVASYRNYYVQKKRHLATWKTPSYIPKWYRKEIQKLDLVF